MEIPEQGERPRRPELSGIEPSQLFSVARARERWIHDRVSERQLPIAIDYFIEELETYVTATFGGNLPEIDITSRDITQTLGFHTLSATRFGIEVGPRPLEGDDAVLNTHVIKGRLFGFHRGESNDIRVYVDSGLPQHMLQGGIYSEYLSVGIGNSTIRLTEEVQKEEENRQSEYVREQLKEYSLEVNHLFGRLVNEIHYKMVRPDEYRSSAQILQHCSPIIAEIEAHPSVKQQLVDAVLDYITVKLQLDTPHTIDVVSHRVIVSGNGYSRGGPAEFQNTELRLCMMGETKHRMLGLFFSVEDDIDGTKNTPKTVQVPVQYIKSIYKS